MKPPPKPSIDTLFTSSLSHSIGRLPSALIEYTSTNEALAISPLLSALRMLEVQRVEAQTSGRRGEGRGVSDTDGAVCRGGGQDVPSVVVDEGVHATQSAKHGLWDSEIDWKRARQVRRVESDVGAGPQTFTLPGVEVGAVQKQGVLSLPVDSVDVGEVLPSQ